MLVTHPPATEAVTPPIDAEAARYALLRRLAPSMRHHLVVNLQPIGMIYEVMERRLRAPQPDLAQVQESAHKINGFARAALGSCLDVVSWLAPDAEATVSAEEGARECTGLMATSLSFRGYVLRNGITATPGLLRRSAVRNLLTGALMYATDHQRPPAEIAMSAAADEAGVRIHVLIQASQGDPGFSGDPPYRKLGWSDLQALAHAEGCDVQRDDRGVTLFLRWMEPAREAA